MTAHRLRGALLKLLGLLYRSGRAFAPNLRTSTHRFFRFLLTLFSVWRSREESFGSLRPKKNLKEDVDYEMNSCLPIFSSSSPPSSPPPSSSVASSTVGCSSPLSDGRSLTLHSITEEEEHDQEPNGKLETSKGYDNDDNDEERPPNIQRLLSDPLRRIVEEPETRSPVELEFEDDHQTLRPGGNTVPPNSQPRGQPKLRPTIPSYLRRYDRNIAIPEGKDDWEISTVLSASEFERKPRPGWSSRTHPEGVLYHCSVIEGLRFSTDVNIFDDAVFEQLKAFTRHIPHKLRLVRHEIEVRDMKDAEIVFELTYDDSQTDQPAIWEYYIADHKSRHLFWLEKYNFPADIGGGVESIAHLKHKINYEYYIHLSYFPYDNTLPKHFFDELRGMVTWTLADSLTSLDSLAPYSEETLERFLTVADRLEVLQEKAPVYAVASGARLWSMFECERYYNFSGAPGARITRDQSVHKSKRKPPSSLSQFLSLLLFQVPVKRLEMLDKLYVDHQVKNVAFKSFSTKLVDSWQAEVINSAVLLNANVAYLAIPGILDVPGEITLGVVASLISITMSLCSVILGLLLTKRLRGLDEKGAGDAADYLSRWWNEKQGLIKLALMFSLPYAMLMWGAISFVVAIIIMAIEQFKFNIPFIILVIVFSVALVTCVWVILQIDSWATVLEGLQFWKWLPKDSVPENERHFVAQRIAVVRRKATAKTVDFVRKRTSTLFGVVTANPSGERPQPATV